MIIYQRANRFFFFEVCFNLHNWAFGYQHWTSHVKTIHGDAHIFMVLPIGFVFGLMNHRKEHKTNETDPERD